LRQESGRFLKKAAQKLLRNWGRAGENSTAHINKVFITFYSQKIAFFLFYERA
jgi:predicted DNA-binding WGR domain protein